MNQEIIESEHTKIDSFIEEGKHLESQNQYKEAIQSYNRVFELDPHDPEALFKIANCLWKLGNNEEADICYEEIIEFAHQYKSYYFSSRALILLNRHAEALIHLDLLIQMDNYPEHYETKGRNLSVLKRYDEALSTCDIALQLEPQNIDVLQLKGEILIKQEKYVLAILLLNQALLIEQTSNLYCVKGIQYFYHLHMLYSSQMHYHKLSTSQIQALKWTHLIIWLQKLKVQYLQYLGMILQQEGKIILAISWFKKALDNGYEPKEEVQSIIDSITMED